jgi:hypothetical protein
MSVLVSSQAIYLSTQQSGSTSAVGQDDGFNRFRMCLNTAPLLTTDRQFARLGVTQFSAYRNFYYVNKFNNRLVLVYDKGGATHNKVIELTKQDYSNVGAIATELVTQLISSFAGGTGTFTFQAKAGTQTPADGYIKGQTGTGIFGVTLESPTGAAHGITNMRLQTQQFFTESDDTTFGDSYALLGGKRISDSTSTASSFTIDVATTADEIVITGFYPMQRSTTQYLYLSCSENTSNLESQNLSSARPLQDTHITSSSIIAKLPINNEVMGFQLDTSTPYFVELDNRHISEILFELKDHHGRTIDQIAEITSEGNLFSDITLVWEVYEGGASVHELKAPLVNFNYEIDQTGANNRRVTGSGFN